MLHTVEIIILIICAIGEVACIAALVNLHFSGQWIREEIHRKYFGTRRVAPWWVRLQWGRFIHEHLDSER